jgi:type IV pilus assembly protein PilY1
VFEPSGHAHWPGNLKKYRIENGRLVGQNGEPAVNPNTGFFYGEDPKTAFSFWSDAPDGDGVRAGGAASQLPIWTSRRLYSNATGSQNLTLTQDAANRLFLGNPDLAPADFGMSDLQAATADLNLNMTEFDKVLAWTLGMDVWALEDEPNSVPQPRNAMGDPLHVRPTAVIYGGKKDSPDAVVFTSTNDGVLHAVDAATGEELWGFVPKRLLPRLVELYNDPLVSNKRYGLDGEMASYVVDNDQLPGIGGDERVFIVTGMRRGGDAVFALEVTDRNNPRLAWVVDSNTPGFEALGQTWSRPSITKVNIGGELKEVVIVGGGYDTGQDNPGYRRDTVGNAIYMIDLETGSLLWSAGEAPSHNLVLDGINSNAAMKHSIPASIKVLDLSGDGTADRMYAGDMGGRIWRFDIANGSSRDDLVQGGLLATLGAADLENPTAADVRRFYSAPDIVAVLDPQGPYLAVNIGSGFRASPLETATTDEFYSVRDLSFLNAIPTDQYPEPTTRDQLINVTTFDATAYPELLPTDKGWRITMVETAGEKILTESITFNGTTFFTSFSPGANDNPCETTAGNNRVYRVSIRDGSPLPPDTPVPPDDPMEPEDRITRLKQGGIAPETILLFPGEDEPTACAGVECFDPGFDADPTRTYWYQDETQ